MAMTNKQRAALARAREAKARKAQQSQPQNTSTGGTAGGGGGTAQSQSDETPSVNWVIDTLGYIRGVLETHINRAPTAGQREHIKAEFRETLYPLMVTCGVKNVTAPATARRTPYLSMATAG